MSGKAMGWARQPKVKCSGGFPAKAVLLLMADHADGKDELFPSISTLAAELGAGERTIQRALRTLEEDGYVQREERTTANGKTTSCRYRLAVGLIYAEEAQGCQSDTPRGATVTPSGVSERRGEGVTVAPSTTFETPIEAASSDELAGRAREAFDLAVAVWLALNPDRVARPRAWAAWQAAVERTGDPEALLRAIQRFAAESADAKAGKIPALDRWLADERYLGRIGEAAPAARGAAVALLWPGPGGLRAELAEALGEAATRTYLDTAGWDEAARAIVPANGTYADRLAAKLGHRLLETLDLHIAHPERTPS